MKITSGFTRDAVERIVWTALQAGGAALLASPVFNNLGLGWQDSLKIAAFAALGAGVKSLVALKIGSDNTAQLGADTYNNKESG